MSRGRLPDVSMLASDPVLEILKLRPRRTADAFAQGPQTFIGRVALEEGRSLQERINRLEAERMQGRVILELNPQRVRLSPLINRDPCRLTPQDPSFLELLESIRVHGQDDPIEVVAVNDDPDFDYEATAGRRRLSACRELNKATAGGYPVLAVVRGTSGDLIRQALRMYRENKVRKDLSPLEYGRMFQDWIAREFYKSQREMAKAIATDETTLSQYFALASLPEAIIQAFPDPSRIALRWSKPLMKALKDDKASVLARAQELAEKPPTGDPEDVAAAVLKILTAPARKPGGGSTDAESVKVDNKVLFTVSRHKDGRVSIRLGKQVEKTAAKDLQADLKQFLKAWLLRREVKP